MRLINKPEAIKFIILEKGESIHIDELLDAVQMGKIFADGKTFVDCVPKYALQDIYEKYQQQKNDAGFNLTVFVLENYSLPVAASHDYCSDNSKSIQTNIENLWEVLTRKPDSAGGSLIPLPYAYIVPGGRFGEIYYWDSYFTMLGLKVSDKVDMIESMVNNFSYLIDLYGYIPNGNRSYFLGRSQPPFYALMIKLLATLKGDEILDKYLPQLKKEYEFWMKGAESIASDNSKINRMVLMPDGEMLNRYWDENETPRPESYREDVELATASGRSLPEMCKHIRAGAESGWDFSSRWFADKNSFSSINTADIIPIDLNCLLYNLEQTIANIYTKQGNVTAAMQFELLSTNRMKALQKYCWDDERGFYFDYDTTQNKRKDIFSLAAAFPLFFNLATKEQAAKIAAVLEKHFLCDGGLTSTLETTEQQWDAPNGWAPLHWITITGLENYGFTALATTIAKRWIKLCTDVFNRTGKLMEKYNVVDTKLDAGGGEYPGQDGFGWTNGVLLALMEKYSDQ